ILQHNLYGVDIDQQAVEVTMMSLYLKMLEGELGIQIPKQDKLPELKYNIRCGNSLIGLTSKKTKLSPPKSASASIPSTGIPAKAASATSSNPAASMRSSATHRTAV